VFSVSYRSYVQGLLSTPTRFRQKQLAYMCRGCITARTLLNKRRAAGTRFVILESGVMSGTAPKEIRERRKEGRKGKTKEDADSTWK